MMIRNVVAATVALLLAGCAVEDGVRPPAPAEPVRPAAPVTPDGPAGTASYQCDNGIVVTVAWGQDVADVSYGGIQWTLPLASSASGTRYADDEREIWEHQGTLKVTSDEGPPTSCSKLE